MNPPDPLQRYSREAVGAFVLLSVGLFVLSLTQAERVQTWLNPGISVKVLMPAVGLYGLSAGADVEILGTVAGKVREIVIDPEQTMHANVTLRREVTPFLRQDSQTFIKRRFGVAGDSYLEITRGTGEPLDLDFAVLQASAERIPTETVEQLITEVRGRLLPILDQAEAAITAIGGVADTLDRSGDDVLAFVASLRSISTRIESGEGTIGRLIVDSTMAERVEGVLAETQASLQRLGPILEQMQGVARNAASMSEQIGAQSAAIPAITDRAVTMLDSLQSVMEDVKRTTPELPALIRNVARSTEELPLMISQTQQTLGELEDLIRQLRRSWLLGGGGGEEAAAGGRISPIEVTP